MIDQAKEKTKGVLFRNRLLVGDFNWSTRSILVTRKIDKNKLLIVEDEDEDNLSVEDLAELLPENTPRYIVLSYELKHDDGRKSYPLVFLYYSPKGVKPELNMLYASAKTYFQNKVGLGKVFDLQDAEGLTDDWLRAKLLK
ncbi:hypothetical protein BGZ97_005514 [Linnemannia gamsii]|uniref:ADF-H domain-containing protein n=1 Tax=Linnemannia gamsii TaxID=64522 RepID=A0A9P6RHB4_9FUNG|nr:hypothetical protein BGZ97_005514 [Linnemannia gamsii]